MENRCQDEYNDDDDDEPIWYESPPLLQCFGLFLAIEADYRKVSKRR